MVVNELLSAFFSSVHVVRAALFFVLVCFLSQTLPDGGKQSFQLILSHKASPLICIVAAQTQIPDHLCQSNTNKTLECHSSKLIKTEAQNSWTCSNNPLKTSPDVAKKKYSIQRLRLAFSHQLATRGTALFFYLLGDGKMLTIRSKVWWRHITLTLQCEDERRKGKCTMVWKPPSIHLPPPVQFRVVRLELIPAVRGKEVECTLNMLSVYCRAWISLNYIYNCGLFRDSCHVKYAVLVFSSWRWRERKYFFTYKSQSEELWIIILKWMYWYPTVLLTLAHRGLFGYEHFIIPITPISSNLKMLTRSLQNIVQTHRPRRTWVNHTPKHEAQTHQHMSSRTPGTEGRDGPTQTPSSYLFSFPSLLFLSFFYPADTAAN